MWLERAGGSDCEIIRDGKTIKETKTRVYTKNNVTKAFFDKNEEILKNDIIKVKATGLSYRINNPNPVMDPRKPNEIHHFDTIIELIN